MQSPARKPIVLPGSVASQTVKADERYSPEWRKKMLMQTVDIVDLQTSSSELYGTKESLFTALKDIFESIISHTARTGIVSPHKFLEILRRDNEVFRSAMHQDAHEFLNLLLNHIVDTVKDHDKIRAEAKSGDNDSAVAGIATQTGWVHDLFEGVLVSETKCLGCNMISQREEPFLDLSVDLDANSSVTSCLRKFCEPELLCALNKFQCDTCGSLQDAERRVKIKRLPRILALHLKRFRYSEDYSRLQKLFHRVVYPLHLRLPGTTEDAENPERLYELYAVVVHIGGGPYQGHYVAIVKSQDRGWLLFDDELVEPVDESFVLSFFGGEAQAGNQIAKQLSSAYVLFYQETTDEALESQREAEVQKTAAAAAEARTIARAAAAKTAEESTSLKLSMTANNMWMNGLKVIHNISTPVDEKDDQFPKLTMTKSAPILMSPTKIPLPLTPSSPHTAFKFPSPKKSKKDLRKDSKRADLGSQTSTFQADNDLCSPQDIPTERTRITHGQLGKINTNGEPNGLLSFHSMSSKNTQSPLHDSPMSPSQSTSAPPTSHGGFGARLRAGSTSLRKRASFWTGNAANTSDKAPPLPLQDLTNGEEDAIYESFLPLASPDICDKPFLEIRGGNNTFDMSTSAIDDDSDEGPHILSALPPLPPSGTPTLSNPTSPILIQKGGFENKMQGKKKEGSKDIRHVLHLVRKKSSIFGI